MAVPIWIRSVARPAAANSVRTSGPFGMPGIHALLNPSSSSRMSCAATESTVAA